MPAELEHGPFGFAQGLEHLSGQGDRIGRRGAEAPELVGSEAGFADQDVVAVERLGAHAFQHALQLGAMAAVWLALELLGEIEARRIDLIHGSPGRNGSRGTGKAKPRRGSAAGLLWSDEALLLYDDAVLHVEHALD